MTTKYQMHKNRWKDCDRCPLCEERSRVVLARGTSVPCDVLFMGEAPGTSENSLGRPFVGPAGQLLDKIIEDAWENLTVDKPTYAMTNLVACIPLENGRKTTEPSKESVEACRPRLREFVDLCKPVIIVAVGRLAEKYLKKMELPQPILKIIHPAGILRMNPAQKPLEIQRCIVSLTDFVQSEMEVPF